MPDPRPPRIGAAFNPYKRFRDVLIPEAMARARNLPAAAKIVYGRLRRYAGEDGRCWPAVQTLGIEVGLCGRQVQKHLRTLEKQGFLRTESRFNAEGQMSNAYVFLWHPSFDGCERQLEGQNGVNSSSPGLPVNSDSPELVNSDSSKEGHPEEERRRLDFGSLDFYSDSEN